MYQYVQKPQMTDASRKECNLNVVWMNYKVSTWTLFMQDDVTVHNRWVSVTECASYGKYQMCVFCLLICSSLW